jgi:uncharacterized membrane protein
MFWIYFLPMLANTLGLIPPERNAADLVITPTYDAIAHYCLPACLVLLLVNVDLRRIWRLGPVALAVMLAGSLGIVVGGPIIQLLFGRWLPPDIWRGLGALSASWVGGSANLVAVAASEGVKTPSDMLGMMIVVDSIVPYAWMGLLIIVSARQAGFDRWNRSKMGILDDLRRRAGEGSAITHPITLRHVVLMFSVAAAATWTACLLSDWLAPNLKAWAQAHLPHWLEGVKFILSPGTLTIILATTMGLVLSFTPVRRLERFGASTVGYGLLYFVLAAIGARTSLARLGGAPVMVLAGVVWVLIHAAFTLAAGRILRVPMALLATASQANIGGTASAPVVAGVYQPGLAPVGLLLAVLGNIIGTYTGIACAYLCEKVSHW